MRRIIAIIAGVWALHSVVAAQTQHGGHGAHATVRRQSMVATPELESAVETYHHGMVAMQRGRLSEAEASFKEALQAQPQLHEASISLANLLMRVRAPAPWRFVRRPLRFDLSHNCVHLSVLWFR